MLRRERAEVVRRRVQAPERGRGRVSEVSGVGALRDRERGGGGGEEAPGEGRRGRRRGRAGAVLVARVSV